MSSESFKREYLGKFHVSEEAEEAEEQRVYEIAERFVPLHKKNCPKCRGTGWAYAPSQSRYRATPPQCWHCRGSGYLKDTPDAKVPNLVVDIISSWIGDEFNAMTLERISNRIHDGLEQMKEERVISDYRFDQVEGDRAFSIHYNVGFHRPEWKKFSYQLR